MAPVGHDVDSICELKVKSSVSAAKNVILVSVAIDLVFSMVIETITNLSKIVCYVFCYVCGVNVALVYTVTMTENLVSRNNQSQHALLKSDDAVAP